LPSEEEVDITPRPGLVNSSVRFIIFSFENVMVTVATVASAWINRSYAVKEVVLADVDQGILTG
jgi:hypothetical protein